MTSGFQVFADPNGNLWVADGYVAQLRSGVRLAVGSGDDFSAVLPPGWERFLPAPATTAATFVGGSGRNLLLSGLTPGPSGPALPVGLFVPGRPDAFARGIFTLAVTGSSAATIHDGTDTVATLSTGGTAPIGNYAATAYGKSTYNGGADFTLAAVAEEGAPGAIPDYLLNVSAGTAQTGTFSPTDAATYVSDDDSDFTITVNSDGSAGLYHLTDLVAGRDAGSDSDPSGIYEATVAGQTAYNSGEPWRAFVQVIPAAPRAGYVYFKLTEAAGILTTAEGPFFATALPADTATEFHIPLAQSDGLGGLVQLHTGLLLWPSASGASTAALQYDAPQTLTLAEKRQARLNADVYPFAQLIAVDNNGNGYPYIIGFLGTMNEDSDLLMYSSGDCPYDYTIGCIYFFSTRPLTSLVINSLNLDSCYFAYDSLAALTFAQLVDCGGLGLVNGWLPGCPFLIYLEISSGLVIGPVITGNPALEQLILANNPYLPDPPAFTGGAWPNIALIDLRGCTAAALTAAKMDTLYGQLDALTINAGSKQFYGNGRYTSASAAARTSLAGKGWTITL